MQIEWSSIVSDNLWLSSFRLIVHALIVDLVYKDRTISLLSFHVNIPLVRSGKGDGRGQKTRLIP